MFVCCPSSPSASVLQFHLSFFTRDSTSSLLSLSLYLFTEVPQEVLLSPLLSPRPVNSFPSCRYYANRLQPRSCVEVSVIMALLALCSSPSFYDTFIYFSTFLIFFNPPSITLLQLILVVWLWMSFQFISRSHLSFSLSLFLVFTPLLFLFWGCCSRGARPCSHSITVRQGGGPPPRHHCHPPPLLHPWHTYTHRPAPVTNKPLGLTYSTSVEAAGVSVFK